MTSLSICIPSHAPLAAARSSIESAIALLPYGDIEVVVSDNSGDSEKEAFFRNIKRAGFRYLRSPFEDGFQNWRYVIDSARGEFLQLLGDDDIITALPGFCTPMSTDLIGKVGFRPSHAMFNAGKGVYRPTNFSVDGARAVDRVQDYLVKNGGSNVTLYSAIRSAVWRNLYAGYLAHHPTRAGFTDWSLTFALLSTAPITHESGLLYLYNSVNWDSEDKIRANNQRGLAAGGLPPEAEQIQLVMMAVDGFVAIARADSSVSADEKFDAGLLLASMYFRSFVTAMQKRLDAGEKLSPQMRRTAELALIATNPIEQLVACVMIIEFWLPSLREPYQRFFNEVLDVEMAKRAGLVGI
jgi:hypothetical protein